MWKCIRQSADDVAAALADAADPALAENVQTVEEYNALREWSQRLETAGTATRSAICAAPTAYLSFALDAGGLVKQPEPGDLKVDELSGSSDGALEAIVSLDDVEIGGGALEARLKQIFGVVGSSELDESKFSDDNVSFGLTPIGDGRMKATVTPKDGAANVFFMRVRLK